MLRGILPRVSRACEGPSSIGYAVRLDILPGVVRRAFKMIWPTDGRLALGTANPVRRLGGHEVCSPAHPRTCQGIRLRDEIKQHLASALPLPPRDTMLSVELAIGCRGD